jgi:hypothetical protein
MKPRKRTKASRTRRKPATPPTAILVQRLGRCVQIQYQNERGHLKTHIFPRGADLHATRDGSQLIVDGVKVRDKEIH